MWFDHFDQIWLSPQFDVMGHILELFKKVYET